MILLCYGTRPEWIKIKPLIEEFKKNDFSYKILFSGQQEDIGQFDYDWRINIANRENRLDSIVHDSMNVLTNLDNNITHVLVQGDTTSALAIALSAFHHGFKVIHLEAGLRTYDKENPYPEEINRRIISQIADIHFCPTEQNAQNLYNEHITSKHIYVVGNTAIDNLVSWKKNVDIYSNSNLVLITLHRRENHHWMDEWFIEINKIAKKYNYLTFIFPVHPNPNVQKHKTLIDASNIMLVEPYNHNDFLNVMVNSRLVITDSGGIQEECSFFNIRCLVCRKVTERPEALGLSSVLVKSPSELSVIFDKYVNDYQFQYECPFGNGHSAEKIVNILKNILNK